MQWMKKSEMEKQTCPECGKTLQMIEYGKGQIKCPRCGNVVKYHIKKNKVTSRVGAI